VAYSENCFIKLNLRIATASGWLQRLVRSFFIYGADEPDPRNSEMALQSMSDANGTQRTRYEASDCWSADDVLRMLADGQFAIQSKGGEVACAEESAVISTCAKVGKSNFSIMHKVERGT
jgi:hypothetical protein